MPTYEYKCESCEDVFERVLTIACRNDPQTCDCGSEHTQRVMSLTNFVLRGDGWPGKAGKIKDQMRKKNERLDRKQAVRAKEDSSMSSRLVPNVEGERVNSWSDAQKMAASQGKSTKSYEPYVRKEAKRGKL